MEGRRNENPEDSGQDRGRSSSLQAEAEKQTGEETRTPEEKDSTGVIYIIPNVWRISSILSASIFHPHGPSMSIIDSTHDGRSSSGLVC